MRKPLPATALALQVLSLASAHAAAVVGAGAEHQDPPVTFTEHVAPILYENCTACHRPNEAAPFPLITYEDARLRGRMLALTTGARVMPPWPPLEGTDKLVGARILSEVDIATLAAWVEGGMPEGPADALPALPEFTDGWTLGPPDLIVAMPAAYEVPASGPDIYRNFVIPVPFEGDRWLSAVEVHPSPGGVVHHLFVGFDPTRESRELDGSDGAPGFEGMEGTTKASFGLGGYVVGGRAMHWPEGIAQKLPAGSDLVIRSHLHPIGRPVSEQTTLGLYFTQTPPTRTLARLTLPPDRGMNAGLEIPAGATEFPIRDSFEIPVDATGLLVSAHAHYLAQSVRLDITPPGEPRRTVFEIPDWRFNWQGVYRYEVPLELPAGTRVDAELIYNNSSSNPSNPFSPPRDARWGRESTDEMGMVGIGVVAQRREDERALQLAIRKHIRKAREAAGSSNALILSRLKLLDANQDGDLSADEVPDGYAAWFDRIDKNGDRVLSAAELEAFE